MQKPYNIKEIMNVLPHRFPMLLLDRIVSITDDTGRGYKNVSINESFFNGHFPSSPVMPGVLQVEGLAQCAGFIALTRLRNRHPQLNTEGILMYFLGIDGVKFRKPVVPGDKLEYFITITQQKESIAADGKTFTRIINYFDAVAQVDAQVVCECKMSAMMVPANNDLLYSN